MNRGRAGTSRAVTGLGSACIGCVGLVAVACGDSFTTAPADGGSTPAGKPPWCASLNAVHTFCEDFSRGFPGMLTTIPMGGGAITADTTDYSYAPPSLLATTPKNLTGTNATASAVATKSFMSNFGSHFSLSLDLEIDGACVLNNHNPVSILAIEFPDNYGIAIQVLPNEIDADEIALVGPAQVHQFKTPSLPSGWQRWALDINGVGTGINGVGTGANKTLSLTVGSTTMGSTTIFNKQSLQNAPPIALQHPTLVVGAVVKNIIDPSSPACRVHVDDILFDVLAR
jgi:hypothetical protein